MPMRTPALLENSLRVRATIKFSAVYIDSRVFAEANISDVNKADSIRGMMAHPPVVKTLR